MATTASWLSVSLVVVLIASGSGGAAVVLILVSGLVISSVGVSVTGICVVCTIRMGVGPVTTIRSVVAITVLAVSPSIA